MKKRYHILYTLLALLVLSACSMKEDAVFDESASQRIGKELQSVSNVLLSAENGWLMEYYGNTSLGGYNVMVKFEGDQATVASEKFGSNHNAGIDAQTGKCITKTSHYKLEQSMGTILSFDEYNEIIHYFAMPKNPDYTSDVPNGLDGDFEFRVLQADKNAVIMQGKKHEARIVMTPIPVDKTWESYIEEAENTEAYMASRLYTLAGEDLPEGKVITARSNGGYRSLVFEYQDKFGMKQSVVAPYLVNDDGFQFYRTVNVDGLELNGLIKGETDDYFVFRNNPRLRLETAMPTLAESFVGANWYMGYESLGEFAKPKWDDMLAVLKTAGKNKDEIKIYTATIGLTPEGRIAASMRAGSDQPYWGFNIETLNTEGTRIKITQLSTVRNTDGRTYYQKYKWNGVLATMFGHTFDLSCDYQRRPMWIKLTDINDPTNVITVYANPRYFMDDPNYYNDLD